MHILVSSPPPPLLLLVFSCFPPTSFSLSPRNYFLADHRELSAEPAVGDEHVLGSSEDHLPKGPHELQTEDQQDGQREGPGTEGQRQLFLHGRNGLIDPLEHAVVLNAVVLRIFPFSCLR